MSLNNMEFFKIPEITEVNRLPIHGAEIPFHDRESALKGEYQDSSFFRSLDGKWDFKLYDSPEKVPADFASEDFSDPQISSIKVPSNWTLGGFGDLPVYTNIKMPFDLTPPEVPEQNPTGVYRKSFTIPATWQKRRTVLHIGGAESYLEVYVNGKFAGMGKDTRLPSEFDLTPFLKKGKNLLVCKVIRWSDSSYVEDQDQWWMAGIYRSVWLYSTGSAFIEDLCANGDYDEKNLRGMLHAELKYSCYFPAWESSGPEKPFMLESSLYDSSGNVIWDQQQSVSHSFRENGYRVEIDAVMENIKPWSDESPTLYTLVTELFNADGKSIDCRKKRIGFRNVRIENSALLINGKRVMIHGVNRHEHSMINGKTLSIKEMLMDIHMLKQYNFNAVRTSHYPNDHRWYDLCDEYGIYVLDEANFECHAFYPELCRDRRWHNALVSRVERMVMRDRSHASIIAWSPGNEAGDGENHSAALKRLRELDNSRVIFHNGELHPLWTQYSGHCHTGGSELYNQFFCPMYMAIDGLRKYEEDPEALRPAVQIEYSHAMGNSCGSLCDYWDLFYASKKLQGGFIWDWIDQGLLVKNRDGKKMLAYGGDFGEKIHDANFNCNGMIASDHRLHPGMFEFRHLVQPVKITWDDPAKFSFKLTNRRNFSDLQDLSGVWRVEIDGEVVKNGNIPEFAYIAPGNSMVFSLPLCGMELNGKEAFVNFEFFLAHDKKWADAGTLIAHDQLEVTKYLPLNIPAVQKPHTVPELLRTPEKISLINGKSRIDISVKDGSGKLLHEGKNILTSLFEYNLFRAGVDNDGIRAWSGDQYRPLGKWLSAGLDRLRVSNCRISAGKNQVTVRKTLIGKNPRAKVLFTQNIQACSDGSFRFTQHFKLPGEFPTLPRIGVVAATAKGFEDVQWFGRGPWENYSDRKRSAHIGKYDSTVSGLYEDSYVVPQENGNRTDTRWFTLASKDDTIRIFSGTPFEFGVSHYTATDLFAAYHQCELQPRKETVITVDLAQRGVGTGSCGPQTLPEYELNEKEYSFSFSIEVERAAESL